MIKSFTTSFLIVLLICVFIQSTEAQIYVVSQAADVVIDTGTTVVVKGNLVNQLNANFDCNGKLLLSGNLTNTATFDQDTGIVILNGSAKQDISGDLLTYYYLELDNAAGAEILQGVNQIRNTLTLTNGTMITNDSLTLLSNAQMTARIAEIPSGADITGDIIMQRYLDPGVNGWHLLGAATSGGTLAEWNDDIVTSGFPGSDYPTFPFVNVYTYSENSPFIRDTGYQAPTNITDAIQAGRGYSVYIGPVPLTLDTKGPANKFGVNLPITYTNNVNINEDGWNLVANPYPSNINWNAAGWTKTNVDNAIYIFDPDNGVYATYVSGIGTNGGSPYIASSQGFWVKANAASPVLAATESVKTDVNTAFFRKGAELSNNPLIRLKLKLVQGGLSDETVLSFSNLGHSNWDSEYDAYKLEDSYSSAPYIATVMHDTIDISINALPVVVNGSNIPLRVKVNSSGQYKIDINRTPTINIENCLYLEDLDNGQFTDLITDSIYIFNISDTVMAPRFLIHSNPSVDLGTDTFITDNQTIILDAGPGFASYKWSNGSTTQQIQVSDSGHYSVEVENKLGCKGTDEIVISKDSLLSINDKYEEKSSQFIVYPNPASGHFFITATGLENGSYQFKMIANSGSLVSNESVHVTNGEIWMRYNTESLSSGLYYMIFEGEQVTFSEKILIRK